jgi:hypothetical protein
LVNLFSGVLSFTFSTTATATNIESAANIAQSAVTQLSGAQPLGACTTDATIQNNVLNVAGALPTPTAYSFTTPYGQCPQYATYGTPYYSLGSSGVCFYSYQYNGDTTGSAPQLECFYQDLSANKMYFTTWKPSPSATYTTCNPVNCWDVANGVAPPLPGTSPDAYVNCQGSKSNCITYDLGYIVRNSANQASVHQAPQLFQYTSDNNSVNSSANAVPMYPSVVTKVDIYAEDDSASSWLGPKKYQISLYVTPGGNNSNAYAWDNQTS